MFEREINFIYDFNYNKIRQLGPYITYNQLLTTDIHPAILKFISAEIDFLIFEDRQKLLKNSLFDYSGDKINDLFSEISIEIKNTKRFSLEYISKLVHHASSFTVNYITKPKWALVKFLFDEDQHKSVQEIKQILNYLYYYEYVSKIILAYFSKKKIISINVKEFKQLLEQIDTLNIESNLPDLITSTVNAISDFLNIGTVNKSTLQLQPFELFLEEKRLKDHLQIVKTDFAKDGATTAERKDVIAALINVVAEREEYIIEEEPEDLFEEEPIIYEEEKEEIEIESNQHIVEEEKSEEIVDENDQETEEIIHELPEENLTENIEIIENVKVDVPEIKNVNEEILDAETIDEIDNHEFPDTELEEELEEATELDHIKETEIEVDAQNEKDSVEPAEALIEEEPVDTSENKEDLQEDKVDTEEIVEEEKPSFFGKIKNNLFGGSKKEDTVSEDDKKDLQKEIKEPISDEETEKEESVIKPEPKVDDDVMETTESDNDNEDDEKLDLDSFLELEEESNDGNELIDEDSFQISDDVQSEPVKTTETEENEVIENLNHEEQNEIEKEVIENTNGESSVKFNRKEIDISELLENKTMTKIIEKVFDYDMEEFTQTIEKITECGDEEDAITVLNNLYRSNGIKENSKEAENFNEIILEYFDRDE